MILIFQGPGTTRIIPGVKAVMGFDHFDGVFIPGKPFGWFREGSTLGFGCMPEFFQKRFTHIALVEAHDKLTWILNPDPLIKKGLK